MSERPTPETDAAVKAEASNGQWSYVLRDTCARLERERDEAREQRDDARDLLKAVLKTNFGTDVTFLPPEGEQ